MSWRDSGDKFRIPITVDSTAGAGGIDVTATIPPTLDAFWSYVASAGADVRLTDADGYTLLTFQLGAGFSIATRTGTVEVDNWTSPAAQMCLLWLYWGSGSTSLAGSFVAAAPKTGYIDGSDPSTNPHRVVAVVERPGDNRPRARVAKKAAEEILVDWDLRGVLMGRLDTYAGRKLDEEITYASYAVLDSGGSAVAGMITQTSLRFIADGWIRTLVKAGTAGNDYTIALTVVTVNAGGQSRTLVFRAGLQVRDVAMSN